MSQFLMISDEPPKEYEAFLTKTIRDLSAFSVRGVAVVALLDEMDSGGNDALTAYYNMSLRDKQLAVGNIQADVTDGIIRANVQRYLGELDTEEEKP